MNEQFFLLLYAFILMNTIFYSSLRTEETINNIQLYWEKSRKESSTVCVRKECENTLTEVQNVCVAHSLNEDSKKKKNYAYVSFLKQLRLHFACICFFPSFDGSSRWALWLLGSEDTMLVFTFCEFHCLNSWEFDEFPSDLVENLIRLKY